MKRATGSHKLLVMAFTVVAVVVTSCSGTDPSEGAIAVGAGQEARQEAPEAATSVGSLGDSDEASDPVDGPEAGAPGETQRSSLVDLTTGEFVVSDLPAGWNEAPFSPQVDTSEVAPGVGLSTFTRHFYDDRQRAITISVTRGDPAVINPPADTLSTLSEVIDGAGVVSQLVDGPPGWTAVSFNLETDSSHRIWVSGSEGVTIDEMMMLARAVKAR